MTYSVGPTRVAVLRLIAANPGEHLRGLERLASFSFGSLRHNLDRLERGGLVMVGYDRRFKRYYPQGMDAAVRRTCDAVRQRQPRRIVEHLLAHPGDRAGEIFRRLDLPTSSGRMHLRRLERLGVAVRSSSPEGTWTLAEPTRVAQALSTHRTSVVDRLVDLALRLFEDVEDKGRARRR